MRYAKSIRYGGEWVSADKCNHTSTENLGLTCPECSELVFWVAGHERKYKNDKLTIIEPRFNHFKKVAEDCELRVNAVSKANFEKYNVIARDQRLEKLKKWFWEIFSKYYCNNLTKKLTIQQLICILEKRTNFQLSKNNLCYQTINNMLITQNCNERIKQRKLYDLDNFNEMLFSAIIHNTYNGDFDLNFSKITNIENHFKIRDEIMSFLFTRQQKDLLEKILLHIINIIIKQISKYEELKCELYNIKQLYKSEFNIDIKNDLLSLSGLCVRDVLMSLIPSINWGYEFERLENERYQNAANQQ